MPADRKGKPATCPRYIVLPSGCLTSFFDKLELGRNKNLARVFTLLSEHSTRGDRINNEAAGWLSEWLRAHAPETEANMLFTVQLSQNDISSTLGIDGRTVKRSLQRLERLGILVRAHEAKRYSPPLYLFGPLDAQGCQDSGYNDTPPDAQGCHISGVRGDTSEPVTWGACSDIKPYNHNINIPNVNDAGTKTLRCPCGSDKPLEITLDGLAICPDCEKAVRAPPEGLAELSRHANLASA